MSATRFGARDPTCPTYDVAPVQAQYIKLMGFLPFSLPAENWIVFCHSLSVTRRGSTASGSIGLRQEFVDKTTGCRRRRRLRRQIRAYFGNHIGVMTPKILYSSARLRLFLRRSLDIPSPGDSRSRSAPAVVRFIRSQAAEFHTAGITDCSEIQRFTCAKEARLVS
jgi:hypothetical protein